MKIAVLCSSVIHPINVWLVTWADRHRPNHDIDIVRHSMELRGGDTLFLISCSEIISAQVRNKYKKALVIHAGDLPRGRGWSPYVWRILEGYTECTVTLLEAEDSVDTGDVWKKLPIKIPKHALINEINDLLFKTEIELMDYALENFDVVKPSPQPDEGVSYFPRRTPRDSKLDPEKSIAEQFDLIRVSDPERYPAFFEIHGHTYKITLEKVDDEKYIRNK